MERFEEDEVETREQLAAYVLRLRDDLLANPDDRENPTLERYLEALAAWLASLDGWFANRDEPAPAQPTWSLVAWMLGAASVHE